MTTASNSHPIPVFLERFLREHMPDIAFRALPVRRMTDEEYFQHKLFDALRIPRSYLEAKKR